MLKGASSETAAVIVSYTLVCHKAVSSVDVGGAVPAKVEASTQAELQAADAALQVPG